MATLTVYIEEKNIEKAMKVIHEGGEHDIEWSFRDDGVYGHGKVQLNLSMPEFGMLKYNHVGTKNRII